MAKTVYEILMNVKGAEQAKSALEGVERAANLLGQLDQAAAGMQAAGTQVNDFVNRANKANADMERGLTNLQVIMRASREDVLNYKDALDESLGRVNNVISTNDALASSYDAASAGYTEAADAMGVMNAGMDLAIAGTSGLDDASDNMAAAQKAVIVGLKAYAPQLAQYGDTTAQATKVSEQLYAVIEKGITDVKALAPAFAELAPTAAGAGLSLEEVSLSFAQITAAGIKASQATTGMKAVLSAIGRGGPTEEAKKMLAEAGVEFDVAAIKAKGFVGVLQDLQAANLTGFDDLFKLTGSTEAANALLTMLDASGDKLKDVQVTMEAMENANPLAGAVDAKTQDKLGQMQGTVNRFEDAMADLGASTQGTKGQLMGLATAVIEAFLKLPEPIRSTTMSIAAIGSGAVVAGSGMVMLASNVATAFISLKNLVAGMIASEKAAKLAALAQKGYAVATALSAKAVTALKTPITVANAQLLLVGARAKGAAAAKIAWAAATALATKATIALNVPLTVLAAKLALLAAPFVAVGALVAGLVVAWKRMTKLMADTRAIEEAEEKLKGLANTEDLVEHIGAVGIKMRETGKALPQAEFDAYIKTMQEAQEEHGGLEGHITALTNLQNELSSGTQDANEASADRTERLDQQADAAEALAEAETKAIEAVRAAAEEARDIRDSVLGDLSMERQSGGVSIDQGFEVEAAALAEYDRMVRETYKSILDTESLSTEARIELQRELTRHTEDQERARFDLVQERARQAKASLKAQQEIQMRALRERAAQERWTDRQTADAKDKLRQEQLRQLIQQTEAELGVVEKGSEKQRALALELFGLRAELAESQRAVYDRDQKAKEDAEKAKADAAKKSTEEAKKAEDDRLKKAEEVSKEQERLAKEETEARKKEWETQTRLYQEQLDIQIAKAKQAGEAARAALGFQSDFAGLQGDALSNLENAFAGVNREAETQVGIRKNIADLADRHNQILSDTRDKESDIRDRMREARGDRKKQAELAKQLRQLKQEEADKLDEINAKIKEQQAAQAESERIERLLATERQRSAQFLASMGISISANATKEQAALAIAQARLAIEEKQTQLKLQQAGIAAELQKAEQDSFILAQQRELLREGLGTEEADLIRAQIEQAERSKVLIDRQLEATKELAAIQTEINTQSARTDLAGQGIDPRSLGGAVEINPRTVEKLAEPSLATEQAVKDNIPRLEGIRQATEAGSKAVASTLDEQLSPIPTTLNDQTRTLSTGFGDQLAATQTQTRELAGQLAGLERAMNSMPERVAAAIPRPQPPLRGK